MIADKVFFISDDDRWFAIREINTPEIKTMTVTYGIPQSSLPGDIVEKTFRT